MDLNEKKKKKKKKKIRKNLNYDKDSDKWYILEVDVEYPENLNDLYNDLPFLAEKKWKLVNTTSLYAIWMIKITMLST